MHGHVLERLVCVGCHGGLSWVEQATTGDDVLTATGGCQACGATYELRDGVAIMAPPDGEDIWRDSAAGLADALGAEPDTEAALLHTPLTELNGADLVFRGMLHEARGELQAAAQAFASADARLYGPEQRACRDRLLTACVKESRGAEWVLDVASGRGTLVERLARAGIPTVASDLSAVAMLRLHARLAQIGLSPLVDCLVADAAALPFADAKVPVTTTYVGLQNIPDPLPALLELRRVCAGPMRTVGHGYPADDAANRTALAELGFTATADLAALRTAADAAGWSTAEPLAECRSPAGPTPRGAVIAGGAVDALPLAPTTIDWYLLQLS